jgi:integrase/recombinase XerD
MTKQNENTELLLREAVSDYLSLSKENGCTKPFYKHHKRVLTYFTEFAVAKKLTLDQIFLPKTLQAFRKESPIRSPKKPVRCLSHFLHQKGVINRTLEETSIKLPDIYKKHLVERKQYLKHNRNYLKDKRALIHFHKYLSDHSIALMDLRIEHVDTFLAQLCKGLKSKTQKGYYSSLRKFLKYLYHNSMLKRDLSGFIVCRRLFKRSKPPKFLRHSEIERLFASLKYDTPRNLCVSAMVHLAYTLGIRPNEISLIQLDDISFQKQEIILPDRKSKPARLPLPEETIKAIAAYIIGGRPKTDNRFLFFFHDQPMSAVYAASEITKTVKKINPEASAYWLRHTYAQRLLENGVSIFQIKEMMGHESIQTTEQYISVGITQTRKVLFDEEI